MIGGNGDPNSGSAILVEFTKAINKLVETGWKPKRNLYVLIVPLLWSHSLI